MKLLTDLDTGEPIIGLDGSLVEGDNERMIKQYMDVMYRTPVGTEQIFSPWGLPIQEIMGVGHLPQWESITKYLIVESLQFEPLIESINTLELERDDNELHITIGITAVNGETVETEAVFNL